MSLTSKVLDRLSTYSCYVGPRRFCLLSMPAYRTAAPGADLRPWHTTLKPYYLITHIVLVLFLAFNVAFVVLWAMRFFDHHLWPITRLAKISQITLTLTQLWSVGPLLMLAQVVQTITNDKSIRRREQSSGGCISTWLMWLLPPIEQTVAGTCSHHTQLRDRH
jgi:predicted PurR-regulated permease PerM